MWIIEGSPKFWHVFTPYNFVIYWPIFKLFSRLEICNCTITKDPTALQVCRYTIPCEMSMS